jgi:hypothetical protein
VTNRQEAFRFRGGSVQAVMALIELPNVSRTNEPKLASINVVDGFAGGAPTSVINRQVSEFLEVFLFLSAALGLHAPELFEDLVEAVRDALLVKCEHLQRIGGVADGFGEGERSVESGGRFPQKSAVFGMAD